MGWIEERVAVADPNRIDVFDGPDGRAIHVIGEHDLGTAPALLLAIAAVAAEGHPFVVDLSEATFIDSTVLRALIHGESQPVPMTVVAPEGGVPRRVLEIAGLDRVLTLSAAAAR